MIIILRNWQRKLKRIQMMHLIPSHFQVFKLKKIFTENLDILTTKFKGLSTIDITAQDEYFSIVDIEDGLGQMSNINVTASENYSEPVSKQDSDNSVKSENAVSDHSPVNSHKMEEEQSQIISS